LVVQELSQITTTVLVVEDEPVVSSLLKHFLARLNLSGRFAANGVEALALIEARPPNLILLDLNMPRMGGIEVLRTVRSRWPEGLPFGVIVLTGLKDGPLLEEAMALGAADVLLKPVSLELLELAIRVQLILQPAPLTETVPRLPPSPPGTILILEDKEDNRLMMKWILEKEGYTILEAKDGDEAFRLCLQSNGAIDLLIADVLVPGINGIDLAQLVQAEWPQVRVLLCSGEFEALGAASQSLRDRAPFLKKPFEAETLLAKVRDTLTAKGR
jgi:CheY-like chemotaxis protein